MSKETLNGSNEVAKATTRSILVYVLDNTLKLLHPMMPFVTEEIWQNIPHTDKSDSIVVASYPVFDEQYIDVQANDNMTKLIEVIRSIRNIRSEVNTPLSKPIPVYIQANNEENKQLFESMREYIVRFVNPSELVIDSTIHVDGESMSAIIDGAQIVLPLVGLINVFDEIKRLEKEKEKLIAEVERVAKKLANKGFVDKAPEKVIEAERAKGESYKEQLQAVEKRISDLEKMG